MGTAALGCPFEPLVAAGARVARAEGVARARPPAKSRSRLNSQSSSALPTQPDQPSDSLQRLKSFLRDFDVLPLRLGQRTCILTPILRGDILMTHISRLRRPETANLNHLREE